MSGKGVNNVAKSVVDLTKKIEGAAGELQDKLNRVGNETLDKFDKVHKAVVQPLEDANKALDELLRFDNAAGLTDEEMEAENAAERPTSTLSKGEQSA